MDLNKLIELMREFQEMSQNWSLHRIISISETLVVPVEFQEKYNQMLDGLTELGVTTNGQPNFTAMDSIKAQVPKVRFYPGERDSFGWVTGVCQINNLRIMFA